LLVLPSLDDHFVIEVADGPDSSLIGTVVAVDGTEVAVGGGGEPLLIDSLGQTEHPVLNVLRRYGPALYVPLGVDQRGTLVLLRRPGAATFTRSDATAALGFATEASLALTLAEARRLSAHDELAAQRVDIARDLHDFVVQELFATGTALQAVRRRAEAGEPASVADVDRVEECLQAAIDAVRDAIATLRQSDGDDSLEHRLRRECARARTQLGFAPTLSVATALSLTPLDGDLVDDLAAIVREALSNTARHAHATSAGVAAWLDGARLHVRVADNGCGLPAQIGRRSGLATMNERAHDHGGWTQTRRGERAGTVVHAVVRYC
jgi:signal transduction histidine kinase